MGHHASSHNEGAAESYEALLEDGDYRVYFDTNSSTLDAPSLKKLEKQAEWLNSNPATTVTVEGHCDERGTREYNLSLGARRANAVRSYLVASGVNSDRIRTISYGKERPTSLCPNETCWWQNRQSSTVLD